VIIMDELNYIDGIIFAIVTIWLVVLARTGIRIYQPIGPVVYGFLLVIRRIFLYIYYSSIRSSRRARNVLVDNFQSIVHAKPYDVSLGKVGNKDFVIDVMSHHTLIGATSGGGKTFMLHHILKQLYDKGSIFFDNTDVYIIDLKGHPSDMFQYWKPVLAGYTTRIGSNIDEALGMLRYIESQLGQELDRKILLIVDEAYILTADKEGDNLLGSIASQLRLNGSLILLVQSPQYSVVKTFIRYNIERRISGLVMSRDQARIILDMRPKQEELPTRVGEYVIREPGKGKLIQVETPMIVLPDDIISTVHNVMSFRAEDLPEMKLLIDIIGDKKKGDKIVGVRNVAPQLGIPNAINFVMVAYRNYTNAGILEAPRYRGGRYVLAVENLVEALTRFKEYLPNWMAAPESLISIEEEENEVIS
jgi:hypothetical protein